jgi:hypothetical protein
MDKEPARGNCYELVKMLYTKWALMSQKEKDLIKAAWKKASGRCTPAGSTLLTQRFTRFSTCDRNTFSNRKKETRRERVVCKGERLQRGVLLDNEEMN